ncbi:MAG: succinate dehydrogenase assembly factor 2 [Burkholderiales bacterium]|nr:succinate dehydrogenase assembly factor 2 [Burkholderiales bacterium]
MDAAAAIDAASLSRLRWRCRRGMLENDLLIARLFECGAVTPASAAGLEALMPLADNDLLDLFLGRTKPTQDLDRPEVHEVLQAIRASGQRLQRNRPSRNPP